MELNYFYTFKEVAKWGSYTRAGQELGYAQSSVTTQIRKLEEHYQVKLFERSNQRMRMTSSGEELLSYVNQVIHLLEEAELKISQQDHIKGTLRIGTVESLAAYFITPYIKSIKTNHPDLKILLESGLCPNLKEGVLSGTYDVAILLDRYMHHQDLTTLPIREESMVMIAHPDFELHRDMKVQDLQEYTLIMNEEGCSYRIIFEEILREAGVEPHSVISFSSLEAIKQCVADDLGVALVPEIAVQEELQRGKLKKVPFKHEKLSLWTQLVYQKEKWISPPIQELLHVLRKDYRDI